MAFEMKDHGGIELNRLCSKSDHKPKYPILPSVRLLMVCFCTIGITMIGSLYSSLNFAYVCMVNASYYANISSNILNDDYGGNLLWDKGVQQNLFAAYSYGSLGILLITAWLIEKFGARLTFGCMMAVSCICTLCIPIAANEHYLIVMLLRIGVGTIGSCFLPIAYNVCAHWSVKNELGLTLAITTIGFPTGQFITLLMAGVERATIGWQWVFYLSGVFCLLFAASWLLLYTDDPSECNYISQTELDYIRENRDWRHIMGSTAKVITNSTGPSTSATKGWALTNPPCRMGEKTPWLKLLSSAAVWACMVARIAFVFVAWSVNQFAPTYLKEVVGVYVKGNGFFSSLPLLSQMFGRALSGPLSDANCFGSRTLRLKTFTFISLFVSSIFYVSLRFLPSNANPILPVFLLCAVMFCASFNTGGFQKSPLYIAPQHSAAIGCLINIAASVASIAMPYIIAGLTPHGTLFEWQIVFYVVAAIGTVGCIFFAIFGSGELQSWAMVQNIQVESQKLNAHPADLEKLENGVEKRTDL